MMPPKVGRGRGRKQTQAVHPSDFISNLDDEKLKKKAVNEYMMI